MADNIRAVRTRMQTLLETNCSRVFYENAKRQDVYPYVVFDLKSFNSNEVLSQLEMEIHILDNIQDATRIETLTDTIWSQLDHYYYIDNDMSLCTYQNLRNNIEESDKSIKHRRLLIELKICN